VQVLHEDWADDWKPENAKRIMNAALTKHGRAIDAVLASNDGTAGGAIQALREEGVAGKVIVTGQDAELVACQRIVSGEQSMTIYKPVEQLARRATEVAIALAKGQPLIARAGTNNGQIEVPSIFHDVVTVTRENIEQTVVADGFHARDQIFKAAE
jgi:D-xylose transport system substrate-binding protein